MELYLQHIISDAKQTDLDKALIGKIFIVIAIY